MATFVIPSVEFDCATIPYKFSDECLEAERIFQRIALLESQIKQQFETKNCDEILKCFFELLKLGYYKDQDNCTRLVNCIFREQLHEVLKIILVSFDPEMLEHVHNVRKRNLFNKHNYHWNSRKSMEIYLTTLDQLGFDCQPKIWKSGKGNVIIAPYLDSYDAKGFQLSSVDEIKDAFVLEILFSDLAVLDTLKLNDMHNLHMITVLQCFGVSSSGKRELTIPPTVVNLEIIDTHVERIVCEHELNNLKLEKVESISQIPKISSSSRFGKIELTGCDSITAIGNLRNLDYLYIHLDNLETIESLENIHSCRIYNTTKLQIKRYSQIRYVTYYDFTSMHFTNLVTETTGHISLAYMSDDAYEYFHENIKQRINKKKYCWHHYDEQ